MTLQLANAYSVCLDSGVSRVTTLVMEKAVRRVIWKMVLVQHVYLALWACIVTKPVSMKLVWTVTLIVESV